jgi:glutaredoxin-like protein
MALISPADRQKLQESFAGMTRPVRLLFFTQTFGCETCLQARQILDELPPLSDKITIEEINLILEGERAKEYRIDRAPAIAVTYLEDSPGSDPPNLWKDSRIRFLGAPAGYEFISLVQAVLLAGGRASGLAVESHTRIALVDRPVAMHVFTTPTCPHCPRAVNLAHEMAFASPNITAYAVEATEFPDLVRRYKVTGVPKTVVNDEVEILGALPEDAFVDQALGQFSADSNEPSPGRAE